jgi:hypothetical protein
VTVRVTVVGQYDGRSLAAAQRDLDKLKRAQMANAGPMGKMAAGLKGQLTPNFLAMGAAVAAAGAALAAFAVKLGVEGVQAAAAEEQAVARLSTALDNVGQGFRLTEVESFIDNLQRASGVADDELRPAMQTLVTATGNATQAQDLLNLALDISVATQKDLTSVAAALGKATNGQFTQVNRLTNGALNPSILATKDLALITGELSRLYGGAAQANADTFAGSIARLKIAADELLEAFGEGFIDAFTEGSDKTKDISDALRAAEPGMREFGGAVADLTKLFAIFAPYIDEAVGLLKYGIPSAAASAAAAFPPLAPIVATFFGIFGAGSKTVDAVAASGDALGDVFHGPVSSALQATAYNLGDVEQSAEDLEDQMDTLNDQMSEFFGFLNDREALRGYESAVDDLRASLKENGKTFDTNTEAGRANEDALDGVFNAAIKVAEGQATAAEKIVTMRDAAAEAKKQLDKTNMSDEAKQRLLQPFDDAILKFSTAYTKVSNLKQEMERLPTNIPIKINVTVGTTYVGTPPPGGVEFPASGGMIGSRRSLARGSDTVPAMLTPGEFVVRRQAVKQFGTAFFSQLNRGVNPLAGIGPQPGAGSGGFSVGSITVNAAPGERAEETVPRALRRMAFLAGV